MGADEASQIVGQTRNYCRSTIDRAGPHRFHHPFDAKFIPFGIERFRHAVGVKHQAIIPLERDGKIARNPIEHAPTVNSKRHAWRP